MKQHAPHGRWVIVLTLLVAVLLTILPLPSWANWARPLWVLMVLCYWALALELRVSVGIAWLMGMLLDVLGGSLFGEHALPMVLCVFIVIKLRRQWRYLPLWQQSLILGVLSFIYQLCIVITQSMASQPVNSGLIWLSVISSAIFWPWIFILLRDARRRFQVT